MVKLTLVDEKQDETVEMTGECVIAFVMEPENEEADVITAMMGSTTPVKAAKMGAMGLGHILRELAENEFDRAFLSMMAMSEIQSVAKGESNAETVERKVTREGK